MTPADKLIQTIHQVARDTNDLPNSVALPIQLDRVLAAQRDFSQAMWPNGVRSTKGAK